MTTRSIPYHPVVSILIITGFIVSTACTFRGSGMDAVRPRPDSLAGILEKSLIRYTLEPWYPRCIDTLHGGYLAGFTNDWSPAWKGEGKALVQQARHLWSTAYIAGHYAGMSEYRAYSATGFRFIRDYFRDPEQGGYFYACERDGTPREATLRTKNAYGQAFTIMALAEYHLAVRDPEAIELAMEAFGWMEERCHDPVHGGYFEILERDGSPRFIDPGTLPRDDELPTVGLKEYNSAIHVLEAFTALYEASRDSLVRERLEEMFILVRDTIVHPDGYEELYFYPDWQPVPAEEMARRSPGNYWFTQHVSFCHDVEVAYLLLDAARVLEIEDDQRTRTVAKRMVDHALDRGWDLEAGGFYYAGMYRDGEMVIIDDRKPWWGESEGLNALLQMYRLFPDDPRDYYGKALLLWDYIDSCLIDHQHGGWYNFGTDNAPRTVRSKKGHWWKSTYHVVRGLDHAINALQ